VRVRTVRQQVPMAMAQAPSQPAPTPKKTKAKPQQQKKTTAPANPKSNLRPLAPTSGSTPVPTGTTGPETAAG
jgi:hypothetical protein